MATIDGTRSGGLLGDDLRLRKGIKISREALRGKLPVMALTHTMVLAVEDIAALAITCKCGVSVTIPVAGTNALDNEKRGCVRVRRDSLAWWRRHDLRTCSDRRPHRETQPLYACGERVGANSYFAGEC